uniref:Uncharacterized protein AlNc14C85G5467 n=1 Tax=Albugo laibachii Nc14 TaxID=890382 RepID=F0WFT2_9STRA|nr:conserved hypothetical protein [Albugo laibachii Nc14]|eukprot:CCA20066.1 conserved hypothetical protein [Albugo laibachii Nc14]
MSTLPIVQEITQKDFLSQLLVIQKAITNSAFIAIDTEFGGISFPGERAKWMDTIEERYQLHAKTARTYPLMQFGLSCFIPCYTENETPKRFTKYQVLTMQFPIFARYEKASHSVSTTKRSKNGKVVSPDRNFMLQAMCIQYIHEHGFDFNDWIENGISYISSSAMVKLLGENDVVDTPQSALVALDRHTEAFLDKMDALIIKLREQLATKEQVDPSESESESDEEQKVSEIKTFLKNPMDDSGGIEAYGMVACLTPPLGWYRSRLLTHHIEKTYGDTVLLLECVSDNETGKSSHASRFKEIRLRIILTTSNKVKIRVVSAHQSIENDLIEAHNLERIGFTTIMDWILESNTPIVGHNLLLDLLYCYEKFYQPLPNTCAEFSASLLQWMKRDKDDSTLQNVIYDTKDMLTTVQEELDQFADRLECTSLPHAFEIVSKHPFYGPTIQSITLTDFVQRFPLSEAINSIKFTAKSTPKICGAHQAGHDAFATGYLFTRLCCALGAPNDALSGPAAPSLLKRFRDRLFLSHFLPPHSIALSDKRGLEMPHRSHLLRLELTRVFQSTLRAFHIQRCISDTLDQHNIKSQNIRLVWEGKQRVFITLSSRECAQVLLKAHAQLPPTYGTETDPMSLISTVDVFICEEEEVRTDQAQKKRKCKGL